ncbi:MAG: HAMP domain-containing protein [Elusimicrobia bacterium]|nr:HAMP domain-containing protein [Elusimicrobiota bacterium]
MKIRTRLVLLTGALQMFSLAVFGGGVIVVLKESENRTTFTAEELLRHAIARTALDALIQRDQVQLLSYLNFLKGQYPALIYARVSWTKGDKSVRHEIGATGGNLALRERQVVVSDPSQPGQAVEVIFGIDRDVLRAPYAEARIRALRILAMVAVITLLIGLIAAFVIARAMTAPLFALGHMAQEIGTGKLGGHLEWDSDDEFGGLVRAFNGMSSRLEEFDTIKRTFVSSVTHELRSPLGAIESFLQLIRDKIAAGSPEGFAQSKEYLDRIAINVRRLSGFINDLLDVAKIEKGKMECVLRPMELPVVVREVCQFFEAKASQQGVAIDNRLNGVPSVMGDADRVRQVLVNLIANGLKFTAKGGQVWIAAEQFRVGGTRWVEITVGDTGCGMDEADRLRLFQPFSQGRNVTEGVTGHKGTGLGLFIVKSIVEQHGGSVDIKSVPGRGTSISFSLKVA